MSVILGKHIWRENSIFNTPKLCNFTLFNLPDHEIEYNLINYGVRKSSLIACMLKLQKAGLHDPAFCSFHPGYRILPAINWNSSGTDVSFKLAFPIPWKPPRVIIMLLSYSKLLLHPAFHINMIV